MLTLKNLPFRNVAAGSVASIEFPIGMTYGRIILALGGVAFTKAHINYIRCKLNGKMFYEITGTRLQSINDYRKLASNVAYLVVDFIEPLAKTVAGMYGAAIGTGEGCRSFTMEISIDAAANAPTLESWSQVLEPTPLSLIGGIVSHPVTIGAAGKYPVVLPYGPEVSHLIKRVHFFHSGNMTALEVKKNGLLVYEEMIGATQAFIATDFGKAPQANHYVYDPCVNNDFKRVMATGDAQSLQFNVTVSAAETLNVYEEIIAPLSSF